MTMIKIVILVITILLPDCVESQRGPPGFRGPKEYQGLLSPWSQRPSVGLPGLPGHRGDNGDEGPSGPVGKEGKRGLRGNNGLKGERGDAGRPGPTGPPGMPAQVSSNTDLHHVSVTSVLVGIIGIVLVTVILFTTALFIYIKKEIEDLKQARVNGSVKTVKKPENSIIESVRYRRHGKQHANDETQKDNEVDKSETNKQS